MTNKKIAVGIFVVVVLLCLVNPASAWLAGYGYRKAINITGEAGGSTYYSVPFLVGSDAGAGGDFHLEGHCSNFPHDIRVTSDDGSTELPYYIRNFNEDPVTLWVNVSDDLSVDQYIFVYYGKAVTTTSNGNTTFLFYSNFPDLADWTVQQGTWAATTKSGWGAAYLTTLPKFDVITHDIGTDDYALQVWVQRDVGNRYLGFCTRYGDQGNMFYGYADLTLKFLRFSAIEGWADAFYVHPAPSAFNFLGAQWYLLDYNQTSAAGTFNVSTPGAVTMTDTRADMLGNTSVGCWGYLVNNVAWYANFTARKYCYPEPAFALANAEETSIMYLAGYVTDYVTGLGIENALCTARCTTTDANGTHSDITNSSGYYFISGLNGTLLYSAHSYRGDYSACDSAVAAPGTANLNITMLSFKLPKASGSIPNVSTEAYDAFSDALGGGNWTANLFNFSGVMGALAMPYLDVMGNLFLLLLLAAPFLMSWIRTGSTAIGVVWGLVLGSTVLMFLPAEFRLASVLILVVSISAGLWQLAKERF